jgi:CRISPR-associated protein Cas2
MTIDDTITIMFVSIAIDPGGEGRAKELAELLIQYGFDKVQRGLWESTVVSPETLNRIKRDLDRSTDAFDRIRIFQFPVDGTLVLTTLRDKKWRRLVAKGGETTAVKTAPVIQTVAVPVRTRPVRTIHRPK